MSFTLRLADSADEDFLLGLYASTRFEEMEAWGWNAAQQAAFLGQQFSARESHYRSLYPDRIDQIILIDGEPGGRILTSTGETEICLVDIALLPRCRGTGIGSRLVTDLQIRARALGKAVVLSVTKDNRAAALYERLGFGVTGDDGMYLGMRWSG